MAGDTLPLGSRIRLKRHAQGVRLSTMASDLGYDKGYLSKVENNQATPSKELIEKIAHYLRISSQDLKHAPVEQLAPGNARQHSIRGPGFVLPAPPLPQRKHRIGQRIERLIAMGHLSEEEKELLEERLITVTRELVALVRATRQLK
jgi:transcriptional regulator with XRE-family HTH domain